MAADHALSDWREAALTLENQINNAVIGQSSIVRMINVALFARGHVLLEGDVGVGKTTVLRAFARAVGGQFERIEGTIDLMPGDLIYHTYVDQSGKPRIDPGPLLTHGEALTTFFFNEINRARPQVQSLLLRAMAERSVSAFNRDYVFPHMTVFADRNKVEKEETFELASAARDRFMFELSMHTPTGPDIRRALAFDQQFADADALVESVRPAIIDWQDLNRIGAMIQAQVRASDTIKDYVLQLWQASESPHQFGVKLEGVDMNTLVLAGASPRGIGALVRAARVVAWLSDRDHLLPDDIRAVLPAVLGHRVFFTPVYEARRAELAGDLIAGITNQVASP